MTKRAKHLLIVLAALTTAVAVGVTLAFMFKKTSVTNTFVPAKVSCAVHEKLDGNEITGDNAVGSEKSDIRVENTGNVKSYIRLRMVTYYADSDENIVGSVSPEYPTLTLKNGWIAGANHTYYYPQSVGPSAFTEILCEPISMSKTQLEDGTEVYQVLEVFAEAVQAEPDSAVQDAWEVTVSNGIITAVP